MIDQPEPAPRTGGVSGSTKLGHTAGRFRRCAARFAFLVLPLASAVESAPAQEIEDRTLRVFLDCNTRNCDQTEFRTEIQFVDWVRDRTVADVHVIMTSQGSAAGTQYNFDFIGLRDLDGRDDKLAHSTFATDTRDEELSGLTRMLRLGLARYLLYIGQADRLDLQVLGVSGGANDESPVPAPQADPWNFWVFRASLNGGANGEERQNSRNLRASFSANRTTADWKLSFTLNGNYNRREVELNDGDTFTDETDDWSVDGFIARSIAGNFATGTNFGVSTSTRQNRKFNARTSAAIEWDYFPYEEANRRSLIVQYEVGVSRVEYEELTIFDKLEETVADQRLSVNYSTRQPWGDASFGVRFSTYLHDLALNSGSVDGRVSIRLFRGFDLDLNGNYETINDQIYLSAEGLTDEEILISRRDLGTGFEYRFGFGFSYRFGSIFNNVVNNRFRRGGSTPGGGGGPGGPGGGR